ncbi:MAG: D-alanyl-D-alanine carboxypeptidase family protein [Oscillospiraceae bacterium]|nr:D-alanyl-D-alanine carboxypeptidase family protein [Oscillospiraceae bacterium]
MKKIIIGAAVLLLLTAGLFSGCADTRDTSGWTEENGAAYYRNAEGDPVTGWQEVEGVLYCFREDGILCTGWQTIGGQRHYFREDGTPAAGWLTLDEETYYFEAKGVPFTGWKELDENRFYFDAEGKMLTGDQVIDGVSCSFREDGTLVTGWQEGRYYLEDGSLATGWQTIEEATYYFDEGGGIYSGWLTEGDYDYYLLEDGTMAVGPTEIDGQTYYFSPHGVHLWLVNPWNYLHEDYEVELVSAEAGYRVAECCAEALQQMLDDCRAAGLYPYLISGYRSYWDQMSLYQDKVAEYGTAAAKQIVAVPGTSEHQLGLAVDITDSGYTKLDKAQEAKPVQKWLMEHCWDYGFILRYPDDTTDITGIIYEPWHYRYVGVEIALELRELGITLEEYLGAVPTTGAQTE